MLLAPLLLAMPLVQGEVTPPLVLQEDTLSHPSPDFQDHFGSSVAISGDWMLVGTPGDDSSSSGAGGVPHDDSRLDSGAVTFYQRQGATWVEVLYLKAPTSKFGALFGEAVAIDGDVAVVGSSFDTTGGRAHVYRHDGTAWNHDFTLVPHNAENSDSFGASVGVFDGTIVVGAPQEDGGGTGVNPPDTTFSLNSGAAYVFEEGGTGWVQAAYLKGSAVDIGDRFGTAVAAHWDRIAVGAPGEDSAAVDLGGDDGDDSLDGAGAVWLYERIGGVWQEVAYVKAGMPGSGDAFGSSVALHVAALVVGAPDEDGSAKGVDGIPAGPPVSNSGAAWVYEHDGAAWQPAGYLKATQPDSGDRFGTAVAVTEGRVAVGAPFEDGASPGMGGDDLDDSLLSAGAVFLYTRAQDSWIVEAYAKPAVPASQDRFGEAVDLDGDRMLVGAPGQDTFFQGEGKAHALDMTGTCGVLTYGPGSGFNPLVLSAVGAPSTSQPFAMRIQQGTVTGVGLLVLATGTASVPFGSGTLLIDWPTAIFAPPGFVSMPLVAGTGTKALNLAGVPVGTVFHAQAAGFDASSPSGFALSNGLTVTVCP